MPETVASADKSESWEDFTQLLLAVPSATYVANKIQTVGEVT